MCDYVKTIINEFAMEKNESKTPARNFILKKATSKVRVKINWRSPYFIRKRKFCDQERATGYLSNYFGVVNEV